MPSPSFKAAEPAIAVERLAKTYKSGVAVDGISFALEPGSITGLLGGNGAGKTTTIAMILGLIIPTAGTARVLGAEMPRQRYRVLHRMNFESPYVDMPHRLTVRQNLKVFGRLYAVEDLDARIATLAGSLDLTEFLDRPTGKLRPGRRPASRSPRRCSIIPRSCCSTSRPPRSIPIPRIGCAAGSSAIAGSITRLCCSHRTTWRKSSGCASA